MSRVKGGKETFPPLEPPIFGAPGGQQSLPALRTQNPPPSVCYSMCDEEPRTLHCPRSWRNAARHPGQVGR
jgi:hypothetical protein